MQILISIIPKADSIFPANKFFAVVDTEKKTVLHKLNFKGIGNDGNLTKGTGMCYSGNHWFAGMIAKEHRVASRLIISDINTGNVKINRLNFTKAVHSIAFLGNQGAYNLILANSTQNDTISLITTHGLNVITEDVYFDFMTPLERCNYNWCKEYVHDDSFHNNSIVKNGNDIYVTMFVDYQKYGAYKVRNEKNLNKIDNKKIGSVFNLNTLKCVMDDVSQPHTSFIDSKGNLLICESGTHSIINISKNKKVKMHGFTRGICEDKQRGGYWVGISAHRRLSSHLKGMFIQFVSYDFVADEPVNLNQLGMEIFDIVPFKGKAWRFL